MPPAVRSVGYLLRVTFPAVLWIGLLWNTVSAGGEVWLRVCFGAVFWCLRRPARAQRRRLEFSFQSPHKQLIFLGIPVLFGESWEEKDRESAVGGGGMRVCVSVRVLLRGGDS